MTRHWNEGIQIQKVQSTQLCSGLARAMGSKSGVEDNITSRWRSFKPRCSGLSIESYGGKDKGKNPNNIERCKMKRRKFPSQLSTPLGHYGGVLY